MPPDITQQAANLTPEALQLTETDNATVSSHGKKDGASYPEYTPRTLMTLPQELRDMVWVEVHDPIPDLALPPDHRTPLPPMMLTSRPPILANICQETRAFAQKRYKAEYETESTSSELEAKSRRGLAWVSRSNIGVLHTTHSYTPSPGLEGRFIIVHDQAHHLSAPVKDHLAKFLSAAEDFQFMVCMGYEAAVWISYRAARASKLPWGWALGTGRNSSQFVDIRDIVVLRELVRELEAVQFQMGSEARDARALRRLRTLVDNVEKREELCALSSERFKALWDALNTDGEVRLKRPMPKVGTVLQFLIMDDPVSAAAA